MPFRSEKQRRYMWMHHPDVARKWTKKYGSKIKKKKRDISKEYKGSAQGYHRG